jgi:hypothetical protein
MQRKHGGSAATNNLLMHCVVCDLISPILCPMYASAAYAGGHYGHPHAGHTGGRAHHAGMAGAPGSGPHYMGGVPAAAANLGPTVSYEWLLLLNGCDRVAPQAAGRTTLVGCQQQQRTADLR